MSTLQVTNIKATGETASRAVSGVAAAWVNFNGTGTIATRDSLNVSSLTDIGTGYYGITFSNNMANVGYSIVASGRELAAWVPTSGQQYQAYYNFKTVNTSFSVVDADVISSNVHGDLA